MEVRSAGRTAIVVQLATLVFACVALLSLAGRAAGTPALGMRAWLNGHIVSNDSAPIPLYPDRVTRMHLVFVNHGRTPLGVATVGLRGTVMGVPLFVYETTVNVAIPAETTTSLDLPVTPTGLGQQATGLIPTSVIALDSRQKTLASLQMVADVRGSIVSLYGLLALAIAALAGVLTVEAAFSLARGRMSQRRLLRGLRFLPTGVGIGLVAVITLSATRVFVPRPTAWLPILLGFSAAAFVIGFLTPAPAAVPAQTFQPNGKRPDDLGSQAQPTAWRSVHTPAN